MKRRHLTLNLKTNVNYIVYSKQYVQNNNYNGSAFFPIIYNNLSMSIYNNKFKIYLAQTRMSLQIKVL
jgi:hypothetical protein